VSKKEESHHKRGRMPWQTAPGLIIIVGCFAFIGASLPALHVAVKGKPRMVGRDEFDFMMEKRDERIAEEKKLAK